jgi:hypothetical protein
MWTTIFLRAVSTHDTATLAARQSASPYVTAAERAN